MNPSISDENDLLQDVDVNPVPYMMLIAGSDMPMIIQILFTSAVTDKGFTAITSLLNKHGIPVNSNPDIHVHLGMLITMNTILKKHIEPVPYEKYFIPEKTPEEKDQMARLNHIMNLLIVHVNNGTEPDFDKLVQETGADEEFARKAFAKAVKSRDKGKK